MTDPRIMYWDIETSLAVMAAFGLYQEVTSHDNIINDWHIISGSWKFKGKNHVHGVCISKPGKDLEVVKALHAALKSADVIVAHNGDKFDLKKFNTRAIFHGLKPLPPIRTVDTLKLARKHFKFTSNRLDYIAQYLGCEGKAHTEKGLWMRALQGDKAAYKDMLKYNKQDVLVLEAIADKMAPYVEPYINQALFYGEDCCPKCASSNYIFDGYRYTGQGKYRRYECRDCGKQWQDSKASRRTGFK